MPKIPATSQSPKSAMDAPKRHFPGRHYQGAASGPFAGLNPTVRRFPLAAVAAAAAAKKPDDEQTTDETTPKGADADEEPPEKGQAAPPGKDEVRADDVQRQWRSRDNRKGEWQCLSGKETARSIADSRVNDTQADTRWSSRPTQTAMRNTSSPSRRAAPRRSSRASGGCSAPTRTGTCRTW